MLRLPEKLEQSRSYIRQRRCLAPRPTAKLHSYNLDVFNSYGKEREQMRR